MNDLHILPFEKTNASRYPSISDGKTFRKIVNHLSRQKVEMCWHCKCCGGGCPFSDHMDLLPNQVIRWVQLENSEPVLRCKTIWICVGCHTCSDQCPNAIDIAAIMDALRQLAIRNGIVPAENDIYRFHQYIFESIRRHGRLNKLEALAQFKVRTGNLFSDLQAGVRMLLTGKLELLPQHVTKRQEVSRIFDHYHHRRGSFEAHD